MKKKKKKDQKNIVQLFIQKVHSQDGSTSRTSFLMTRCEDMKLMLISLHQNHRTGETSKVMETSLFFPFRLLVFGVLRKFMTVITSGNFAIAD